MSGQHEEDAKDRCARAIDRVCATPDRRPIYEWAREHVALPGAFTVTGNFNVEISRHLVGVFDALQDDLVRSVTLMKPTRGGGSMIADVWFPWVIANDPGPMMWNHQTDAVAGDMAGDRLMPILERCAPVAALFPDDRHKKRKTEIQFTSGVTLYVQGPSVSNLQSKGIRYQVNSEVWIWKSGRLGDAHARVGDFEQIQSSKVFNESQAGLEDDDFHMAWRQGNQCEWCVPCLSCGHVQPLKWSGSRLDGTKFGMRWDDGPECRDSAGRWNLGAVLPTIRYECAKCGHPHLDNARTRAEWNRLGRYVAMNPRAARRDASFHFNAIVVRSWEKLVGKFLAAMEAYHDRGATEPLQEFTQKDLAEPWAEKGLAPGVQQEAYEVESDWPEEAYRFLTVDVQAEGVFWAVVRAWAKSGESRRLWFGKLHGWGEVRAMQERWKVKDNKVLVDSGYEAKEVYGQCVKWGWVAVKGDSRDKFDWIVVRKGQRIAVQRSFSEVKRGDPEKGGLHQARRFAALHLFSDPVMQDRLDRFRSGRMGKWLLPAGPKDSAAEEEYLRQLSAEFKKRVVMPASGRVEFRYIRKGDNHLRDCEKFQVLAATMLGICRDGAEEEVSEQSSSRGAT